MLLAPSTVCSPEPSATANQVRAKAASVSKPSSAEPVEGRRVRAEPDQHGEPTTRARLTSITITLPSTCPVSTAGRTIAIVRNLATMPSVMSMATEIAGDMRRGRDGHQQDAGVR